jgi:hypothetical protein
MMSEFDRAIDQLNLTYAQVELIKQAVEKTIIEPSYEMFFTKDIPQNLEQHMESVGLWRDDLRNKQKKALRG